MITCSATFIRCGERGPKLQGTGTGRNAAAAFARAARQAGLYVRRDPWEGWTVNTMPDRSGTEHGVWLVGYDGEREGRHIPRPRYYRSVLPVCPAWDVGTVEGRRL